MKDYRLYFLDGRGSIEARQEFRAEDDAEAKILAALLFDACSDTCAGYEVWSDARLVVSTHAGFGTSGTSCTPENVSETLQRNLLDLEDALQRSHWRLAKSKRLQETMAIARERLAALDKPL